MSETSIATGKISLTQSNDPDALDSKKFYVKLFPGAFYMQAPRAKKAKVLFGELLVRYSGREWPEKKNGPLVGHDGFLQGISELLKELKIKNHDDLSWAAEQRPIKDTVTIQVGSKLAQEILDRGWATLSD